MPAPLCSAACCLAALAVEDAAGSLSLLGERPGLAIAEVLWTASAASFRAATGVLDGRAGSPGRMFGSLGTVSAASATAARGVLDGLDGSLGRMLGRLGTESAASVKAATGVLDGRDGSLGRMLGSWGTSPCAQQHVCSIACPAKSLKSFNQYTSRIS